MGARHRDGALEPRDLAEQVAAVEHAGRVARAASSGLSSGIAVETTTSAPAGTLAASWPIAGSMPAARSRAE